MPYGPERGDFPEEIPNPKLPQRRATLEKMTEHKHDPHSIIRYHHMMQPVMDADMAFDEAKQRGSVPDKKTTDAVFTSRMNLTFIILDDIPESWLKEQIENAQRYQTTGFITSKPHDYLKNHDLADVAIEGARVLLKLKAIRKQQLEASKSDTPSKEQDVG